MSDIFISYSREDRTPAEALARALEAQGWSVWWDRAIPAGKTFDQVIEEAIEAARCVIVLWSKKSVASRWVRTEAEEGARRDALVPVLIEEATIPLAFRRIQAADLTGWDGDQAAPAFEQLVADLAAMLGPSPLAEEEEQRRQAEEERKAEDERRRQAEARHQAELEEEQRQARAEEERQAEARRQAELEEEERRTKAEEERQAEEERARAEDERRRAEQVPVAAPAPTATADEPPGERAAASVASSKGRKAALLIAVVAALIVAGWLVVKLLPSPGLPPDDLGPQPGEIGDGEDGDPPPSVSTPEMVVIPGGKFMMGSADEEDERPQHEVKIAPFALGRYEVTREEFAASGLEVSDCAGFTQTERERDPVVCVSWEDAKKYIQWLSAQTGHEYRLPTEAEWEYAARAKTSTARYWGDDTNLCKYANARDQTYKEKTGESLAIHDCTDQYVYTAPVGSFIANDFGLYDMLGNVWEWTEDCYNENYSGAPTNGSAWTTETCTDRVVRGGSWSYGPGGVRAADRYREVTTFRNGSIGFRVARTLP